MSMTGDDKKRDREIAANEEERQATGAVRVSAWAIVFTIIACAIVFYIGWAWLKR